MAVYNYVGWPTNVNKVILDSSSPTFGEGALKSDTLESGMKRGYRRNSYVPDKYSIVMEFDWVHLDNNGDNEYERFMKWYKYIHCFGVKPFQFPKILYSPETGIRIVDENSDNYKVEYYKITSPLPGKKTGEKMQVTMTWESVYTGVVQVEQQPEAIRDLVAHKNYCEVNFSAEGLTNPVSDYFKIYEVVGSEFIEMPILGFSYSDMKAKIYYTPLSKGLHVITFDYVSEVLSEIKTFKSSVSI